MSKEIIENVFNLLYRYYNNIIVKKINNTLLTSSKFILKSRILNRLLGGIFNFEDYYYTTASPDEYALRVSDPEALMDAIAYPERHCAIHYYMGNEEALLDSFSIPLH